MRNRIDFSGLSDRLVNFESSFGINKMGGEKSVDEGALAETSLA